MLLKHNLAVMRGVDAVQSVFAGREIQILYKIPLRG
jgi:hypothetical protein